jgi:signal transduction histidine kinase
LNAVQAMPEGGRLTISTRAHPAREGSAPTHVVIQFQDTGCGMSEGRARRAFTSLLGTTKRKGTGLGLAIVQRVVEGHRGQVRLASRKGQGTCVVLTLPCAAGQG